MERRRLAEALERLAVGDDPEAVETIERITRWRSGLAPLGEPADQLGGLKRAAELLPENLSLRVALAEALAATGFKEDADALAISAIRKGRPFDRLATSGADLRALESSEISQTLFHSVDTGRDFFSGRFKPAVVTAREALQIHWPDLAGKSVLDIGAYDGWYSFEAERRGAAKVTANDYYSWMADYPLIWAWVAEQQQQGLEPDTYHAPYPALDPRRQPGRKGFDLAKNILSSRVETAFGPIESIELEAPDVVLLLGVLYHSENPIGLLRRAYELTTSTLILETLSVEYPSSLDSPIWHFYGAGDVFRDNTTMWAPSCVAIREALLKVGFKHVEVYYGWDSAGYSEDQVSLECRLWVHAHK